MINVPIVDQGKKGTVLHALIGGKRQIIAYPTYVDIYNAKREIENLNGKVKSNVIPLYQRQFDDNMDTVYFTDSLQNLCTSDNETIKRIMKKIDDEGAKFTSKIHRELHPDPECRYTIQNKSLHELLSNYHDFHLLITTINKAAYNPLSLSAQSIHIVLNEAFYNKSEKKKNDFITHSHNITKPRGLSDTDFDGSNNINGYYRINNENLPFTWFKENKDGSIQIPSTLEELFLNLTFAQRTRLTAQIIIYSRDAYIDDAYLPAFGGIKYVYSEWPHDNPQFRYFPQFRMSSKRWKTMNLPDRLLMFREIDKLVKYVADRHEGKIALLIDPEMDKFIKFIRQYQSTKVMARILDSADLLTDNEWVRFIDAMNVERKRKFSINTSLHEVIKVIIADFYHNHLAIDPWTRVECKTSNDAFYDWEFAPDVILMIGTNYQFYQAAQIVSGGNPLNYHSIKEGGITFTDQNVERSFCKIYAKTLTKLPHLIATKFVYIADPIFAHWQRVHSSVFASASLCPSPTFLQS